MPVSPKATVTVRFDGLLLFCLDELKGVCEAKICTAAADHELKIKVFRSGGEENYGPFTLKDILGFHPIELQVTTNKWPPGPPLVKDSSYDLLLNLAGNDFYGSKAVIQHGRYDAAFLIKNGKIGAGDLAADCKKVNLDDFKDVSFHLSEPDWDQLIAQKQAANPQSVANLPPFAKDVVVAIEMEEGQDFKMTTGKDKQVLLLLPFLPGENYHVEIGYADAAPPTRLGDCIGFAHHSEAVKPKTDVMTYSIFRPLRAEETDPGCCLSGCILPPGP
ncbi:MAG: hypothetical protein AB7U82_01860 [Blastocatellales bacterium]